MLMRSLPFPCSYSASAFHGFPALLLLSASLTHSLLPLLFGNIHALSRLSIWFTTKMGKKKGQGGEMGVEREKDREWRWEIGSGEIGSVQIERGSVRWKKITPLSISSETTPLLFLHHPKFHLLACITRHGGTG